MREEQQTDILIAGDEPSVVGSMQARPITFATLLVLRKLGNPLAQALENGGSATVDNLEALAEFLWVQCAPWQRVRALVSKYARGCDRAEIDAEVLDFAAALTPEEIQRAVDLVAGHAQQVAAVAAEVVPDGGSKSKN